MNWEALKHIYYSVLICNYKIEYLGGDKYKLIAYYPSGEKHWETEFKNRLLHGNSKAWCLDGSELQRTKFKNGKTFECIWYP